MLFYTVEECLIGQGYGDIITVRSNRLKKKIPTEDTQTNISTICSKNWKYFRLLVRKTEGEGQGGMKVSFSIAKSQELSQEEYEILQEALRPGMRVQAKRKVVEGQKCPICGSGMFFVKGKRGLFYSCIKFPDCKGSLDYHEPEKQRSRGAA